MKIRRLQYNIDYTHILTFKDEYKDVVMPYFGFEETRYGIDNENTINESIRLIFMIQKISLFIRKDGLTILFEGSPEELKNPNGIMKFFWDIYEKIQEFKGYHKTGSHSLLIHAVDIKEEEFVNKTLAECSYMSINQFGKLEDFALSQSFIINDKDYKFTFGNYSEKDINVHDLTPFKTSYNNDLFGNVGLMCRYEVKEKCNKIKFSKFKSLLIEAENKISQYNI